MIFKLTIEVWTQPGEVRLDGFVEDIRAFFDAEGVANAALMSVDRYKTKAAARKAGLDEETEQMLFEEGAA